MKRSIYLGLTLLIISGLSACTSYNYYTAGLNKTNLSNYHTFAWMPVEKNGSKMSSASIADAKIRDAATMALAYKGLVLKQNHPDLLVSYTTTVGKGSKTTYYTNDGFYPGWGFGWGAGFGWGGWGFGYRPYYYAFGAPFGYGGELTYAEQQSYKEGTLIIDLVDRRTKKVVWRGYGVGEVHHDPQKNIDDIPKVVDGILKQLQINGTTTMVRTMSS